MPAMRKGEVDVSLAVQGAVRARLPPSPLLDASDAHPHPYVRHDRYSLFPSMIATTQVLSFSTPELELAVLGLPPAVDGRPVEGRPVTVPLLLVAVRGLDCAVRGRAVEGREEDMITISRSSLDECREGEC